jgi:CO/xanthine dehydrogenase Mo-binding subunit
MWTREDDVRNGRFNPLSVHYLRAGFDAAGKLIAFHHRKACDEVTAFQDPVRYERARGRDVISFVGIDAPYYAIPNRLGEAVPRESGLRTSSLRGISHLTNIFAIESFMDELARAAGVEPTEFRLRHLTDNPRLRHVLELVAPEARGRGVACMRYGTTYVAQVAEVDARAPDVRVRRVICAFDCGQMINPDGLHSQIEGSIAWAAGATLFGEITVTDGRVVQSNFSDYRVLRMREMPEVEVRLVDSHEAPGGAGEPAVPCVAPAITNALFAATGRRARRLPLNAPRSA